MKKQVIFFGLFYFFGLSLYSQRRAEIVMDPFPIANSVVQSGDVSYIAPLHQSSLYIYSGEELAVYNYPFIAGERLTCGREGISKASTGIYINLMHGAQRHVYQYLEEGVFRKILFPGELLTSFAVYNNDIYMVSRAGPVGAPVKLYKFDGRRVTEVSGVTLSAYGMFRLIVGDPYFYICGGSPESIIKYDGLSFVRIPSTGIDVDNIREIHTLSGTEDTYIHDFYGIYYYNGTTTERVYSGFPAMRSDMKEWRGKMWVYATVHPFEEPYLVSIFGREYQNTILPEGYALIPRSGFGIFRDTLYVAAKSPDESLVLFRYNDTTFTQVIELPEPPAKTFFYPREDGLVILPDFRDQQKAYLYHTGDTTAILAPEGYDLYDYHISSGCYHLWGIWQADSIRLPGALAVEKHNCPYDTTGSNYIIPEPMRDFARLDLHLNGRYRNWCWSEIILNWQITPECPLLQTCPDPLFSFVLREMNGTIIWESEYRNPLQVSLPVKDQQPYQLTLFMGKKEMDPIIVFDQSLVSKGIDEIGIKINPVKEEFILQVSSRKKKATCFSLAVLDKQGKKVWEENFQAPFEKRIQLKSKLPGTTLFFSVAEKLPGNKKQDDLSKTKE